MKYQQGLFSEYLDPIKLKEGKTKCPCCARPMKAYGYNLDFMMVDIAMRIYQHCVRSKTPYFSPKELFAGSVREYTQFQKLQYFGIIKREKNGHGWKLTWTGYKFLKGKIKLPKKVWVFRNTVVLKEDELISVFRAQPNWKVTYFDWINDYILQPYETDAMQMHI